jgi:hypothetical protein
MAQEAVSHGLQAPPVSALQLAPVPGSAAVPREEPTAPVAKARDSVQAQTG